MSHRVITFTFVVAAIAIMGLAALSASAAPPAAPPAQGDAEQGAYIYAVIGGCGCHNSEAGFLAGWAEEGIEGPWGVIYISNITPDPETGIGAWTDQQIIDAVRLGRRPDGRQLSPFMPYEVLSGMADQDVQDLVTYLRTVEPVKNAVPPTELKEPIPPFEPPAPPPAIAPTEGLPRGEYLVSVSGCSFCHTPTGPEGAPDMSKFLAGGFSPEFGLVPNITPDKETGIGGWTEEQIATFLRTATRPDGSRPEGMMLAQVEEGWKDMTEADALVIAAYLKTVPAVVNVPQPPKELPETGGTMSSGPMAVSLIALLGAVVVLAGLALRRWRYRQV